MKSNPTTAIDFYKVDHKSQYPPGTNLVFSNYTPRKSRIPEIQEMVFFGLQYFIKDFLIDEWNENFFKQPKQDIIKIYKRRIDTSLGPDTVTFDHLERLHDLGYLPLIIMAVPEGSRIPMRVAPFVIFNTHHDFRWLTNYIETVMSQEIWGPCTSASIAAKYKENFNKYADETVGDRVFTQWQGHDFSSRGMYGRFAAMMSGAGHLLSFTGTDTVNAIDFLERYYNADCEKELIGASVPATEHSVMCMGLEEGEKDTIERLITKVYPKGIVSIVSDSWDFWKVITEYALQLKDIILSRDGKVVFRPDTGDPADILCGDPKAEPGSPEYKGAVECLWDIFGGTLTKKNYKLLDSHVGLIYGDSITLNIQMDILERLKQKGFCSSNVVLGIGSYTYQYVTRDTFGTAIKATYGEIHGVPREIFKKPKTGDGMKNSAKGLIAVYKDSAGKFFMKDQVTWNEVNNCEFKTVFENGKLLVDQTLAEIRARVNE